jgi:GNAT superfamily N-acetyltransferase
VRGFRLRPATEEHGWLLCNLAAAVASELAIPFEPTREGLDLRQPRQAYRDRGGELWTLEVNDAVAGCLALLPDGRGGAELRRWLVVRAHRRLGLGRLMVKTALEWAAERDLAPVWTTVPEAAGRAVTILSRLGFVEAPPADGVRLAAEESYLEHAGIAPETNA